MFFDSHCHLTAEQLAPDFQGVLDRALAAGVSGFLNIGDDLQSSRAACEQAEAANARGIDMWASAGVHPQNAAHYEAGGATSALLLTEAAHPKVRAIGEIGLDFVYDETHPHYPGATRRMQEIVLHEQLEVAAQAKLPVVIHNREADERLLHVIAEHAGSLNGGVFHCFGSDLDIARRVLDLGFHLGFTGLVTFKNAEKVREVARKCPLDRLLIETDSPYLAPVPHRGKTNEPGYLPRVAQAVATLHNLPLEELAAITTHNAMQLFRLDSTPPGA